MAFQTTHCMDRLARMVQYATNSVLAFTRVPQRLRNADQGSIAEMFINNVALKGPKS